METQDTPITELIPTVKKLAFKDFKRLHAKLIKAADKPRGKDVTALRQLVVDNPQVLPLGWTIHETIRGDMIDGVITNGASRALLLGEVDRWRNELGYLTAPPLERIHMDTIVTCRLRLAILEFQQIAAQKTGKIPAIEHADKLLSSAHHRLNKAVESLARIRLLATRAPVFQFNVATNGGQQVNVS
jgi:hypothetical protein